MTETKGPSVLQKFFALNSKPNKETFPELPDAVVWMRFVLALVYGVWLGIANQRGGASVIFGLNFVTFVPIVYCSTYLGADSESYGTKLFFSGVVNSLALLLLIWIYFFTLDHADDEKTLISALADVIVGSMANNDTSTEDMPIAADAPIVEDSEF